MDRRLVPGRCPPGVVAILLTVGLAGCGGEAGSDPLLPVLPERTVLVDHGHHNSHTLSGTLAPLGELFEAEGFTPIPTTGPFRRDSLERGFLLVISNALHASNVDDWRRPVRSAFTDAEVEAVRRWVEDGGALLLIADHMPFPGAARELAAAFGVAFHDGFAFDPSRVEAPKTCLRGEEIDVFRRSDGSLGAHPITDGVSQAERVDSVATFTGQAFEPSAGLQPLLVFGPDAVSLEPEEAWVFTEETPRTEVGGWYQGAVKEVGRGRVAFFGEAAMFTEQTCGNDGSPMGMNAPHAAQNARLIRNLVGWLHG